MVNGVPITQSHEHYNYRAYLETLLTYGTYAASSHLSNYYWYLVTRDMQPSDPTAETHTSATKDGIISFRSTLSGSRDVYFYCREYLYRSN
jgi:hypothetical protein